MKFFFLVRAGLWRRPVRSILTLLSATVAFFLLGVLSGVVNALDNLVATLDDNRIRVVSRAGFGEHLPSAHVNIIRTLDTVRIAAPAVAFPGYFQDPANAFGGAAVEMHSYLDAFGEFVLSDEERAALLNTRNGATAGSELAKRFGWKVGDEVPLTSTYLVNKQGNKTWPVKIVAIHNERSTDNKILANEIYVNLEYVDSYRADKAGVAHMFVVTLNSGANIGDVIGSIDQLFRNSGHETNSVPEKELFTSRMQQIGDIDGIVRAILSAVFLALLFVLASALIQSIGERKREFGVLKAIGFSDLKVVGLIFFETLLLVGLAWLLGLASASAAFPFLFAKIAVANMYLTADVWLLGGLLAMFVSAIVALRPMWLLARLQPAGILARA